MSQCYHGHPSLTPPSIPYPTIPPSHHAALFGARSWGSSGPVQSLCWAAVLPFEEAPAFGGNGCKRGSPLTSASPQRLVRTLSMLLISHLHRYFPKFPALLGIMMFKSSDFYSQWHQCTPSAAVCDVRRALLSVRWSGLLNAIWSKEIIFFQVSVNEETSNKAVAEQS